MIVNLTPPGAEPHDLEVTPDQAATIEDAALVLTMGQGLQPSVEDAAKRRASGVVSLLNALGIASGNEHPRNDMNKIFCHDETPQKIKVGIKLIPTFDSSK